MDRKLIAVAVSSALALPMAAQAADISVSGHVNRAIIMVDQDGNANDGSVQHVDANSSQTRWRIKASGELANGATAGAYLEYGLTGNVRQANVSLTSAGGTVTLGHASQATDGMAHADLGGAAWLGGATNWGSYACGASPACPSNDGNRSPVLKYDTPAFGAAKISASMGNNDFWDAKLSVSGSMGDSGYDVRVGYKDDSETVVASAAFSMGQGTSVAVAWSQSDAGGADYADEYQYVKLDHSYGDGSVGVYYKRGEEGAQEGSLWGIGVGHSLGAGTTAYAGWRNVEGDGLADLNLIFAGMRVTFN
jgi:predicted porin